MQPCCPRTSFSSTSAPGHRFELVEGEVLGLVGESASGKTTAATSLLNFQRPGAKTAGGLIHIDDRDVLALGWRSAANCPSGPLPDEKALLTAF